MFRIVKKPRGYIVEVQISKWTLFGLKKVWKPYVKSSGLDCAWHHRTYEMAVMNLKEQIEKDLESITLWRKEERQRNKTSSISWIFFLL